MGSCLRKQTIRSSRPAVPLAKTRPFRHNRAMDSANPLGKLPQVTLPHPEIYQKLGREGIENLVKAVYRLLGKSPIAAMFPQTEDELMASAAKSALFWVTICGGPPLYEEKFGHPRMRARHMGFAIDEASRRHWVACWDQVLATAPEDFGFPAHRIAGFRAYIDSFSQWMVNR